MRALPAAMQGVLDSGDFTGTQRAVTRVTIQKVTLGVYTVGDRAYSSMPFPTASQGALELPNVKSLSWQRDTQTAVGSCSMELFNTEPLLPGQMPATGDVFDQLGYYTFNRGRTAYSKAAWGHEENVWQDYLTPDRVIRIYQGYGADYDVVPESDPHLLLMGCYVIDEVVYTADGLITVNCRDFGRLLIEQIAFPPVIPMKNYPIEFEHNHLVVDPDIVTTSTTDGSQTWTKGPYQTDSNVPYIGKNGSQYGHHGSDAFDNSDATFWMSIGNNRPTQGYSFEYVQCSVPNLKVNAARCHVWGGPYTVYLSVKVGDAWQGAAVVPYDPHNPASAPNGSNIPFVQSSRVDRDGTVTFNFTDMANVTAIRFCFTDLFNSGLGTYKYRAGVRNVEFLSSVSPVTTTTTTPGLRHVEGNFEDFTDIIKLLLAYGGFYWTPEGKQVLTSRVEEPGRNHEVFIRPGADDPVLGVGRVWGDLQNTKVPQSGIIYDLTMEVFDKKPLMDGINHIRDLLGFLFCIDETGQAIWRLPNMFNLGNWVQQPGGKPAIRTTDMALLSDSDFILGLRSTLSSHSLRELVLIGDTAGKIGAAAQGRFRYLPKAGFRRVAIWTDQGFSEIGGAQGLGTTEDQVRQAQVMADMIALRQLFTYRQNSVRIAGNPRIQIDDQIKIRERTTGEDYVHHVTAISSQWDLASGQWTYDLTTSWLGVDPVAEWAFTSTDLAQATRDFLNAIGNP